jgi:cytoskeletal protein CcmA (bactofilin family)
MTKKLVSAALLAALSSTGCMNQEPRIADVARAVCPPPDLFEHAVCVCEDLTQVGTLRVLPGPAGGAKRRPPYNDPGAQATSSWRVTHAVGVGSVGVNGATQLVSDAEVAGTWIAYGGLSAVGVSIGEKLITPGDVELTGDADIETLVAGGDLVATGTIAVRRLELGGSANIVGDATIAERAPFGGAGNQPCGCDEQTFFDVDLAVRAARQATDATPSWQSVGQSEVRLTTGSYYVTSAEVVGDTTFIIDGNASVFVDGSLTSVGTAQWQIAPGGSLDLFVSGDVAYVGTVSAGDPANAGAFRLYVGSTGTVELVGEGTFAGSLYAPRAAVTYVGDARVVGSIFARTVEATGNLTIEYGEPLTPPQSCEQPPAPAGEGVVL